MLYTREELQAHSDQENTIAIQRYFHNIHTGQTAKLAPHELEYLALRLRNIFKDPQAPERFLEPYDLPFLSKAIFKHLFLVYQDNLDFIQPAFDGTKELSREEINRDKNKFNELLQVWREKLHGKKGDKLLHEVKLEYIRKINILNVHKKNGLYGWFRFQRKCLEQELNAFYIYSTVRLFFKNKKTDHIEFRSAAHRFVINYYSYVHIISRHYIPKLNGIDTEKSFNDSLPFIDPFNLPTSLADLIMRYLHDAPRNYLPDSEWMIFNYKGNYYIIWWKEKPIDEIGRQIGFEVRTLYKIQSATDRSRIHPNTAVAQDQDLIFYY